MATEEFTHIDMGLYSQSQLTHTHVRTPQMLTTILNDSDDVLATRQ